MRTSWPLSATGAGRYRWRVARIVVLALALGVVGILSQASPAFACSPPFERPTIAALGPEQVVILGTVGEPVAGGRHFYVERWYHGDEPANPIVIAFKEGPAVGDCSYPIQQGAHLIIAPYREPDGRLSADLSTLQADPMTPDGQAYVAEAMQLFGTGVALDAADPPDGEGAPVGLLVAIAFIGAGIGAFVAVVVGLRRRESRRT
jgi:hypothetical protein